MLLQEKLCPWLEAPLAELAGADAAGRLGHAWLIAGRSGLGKLNLALVFADRLLHGHLAEPLPAAFTPDEVLAAMRDRQIPSDHHPDLHLVMPEEDKKTIVIEQVREVTEALTLKALKGGAKCVVIAPAEAMTPGAANALLKSLEEPTANTYLLLVSHRPGRLPPTIRSRCQTLVVQGPPPAELEHWLGGPQKWMPAAAVDLARMTPLVAAQSISKEYISIYSKLHDDLASISKLKADPQAVAEQWIKLDQAIVLDWLARGFAVVIRGRLGSQGRNPVTDRPEPFADNSWESLTTGELLEQLRKVEALRDQIGTGINAELGLKVLLLGFVPSGHG